MMPFESHACMPNDLQNKLQSVRRYTLGKTLSSTCSPQKCISACMHAERGLGKVGPWAGHGLPKAPLTILMFGLSDLPRTCETVLHGLQGIGACNVHGLKGPRITI